MAARDIICPFPALSHLGNFNAFLAMLPRVREAFGVSTQVFTDIDPQAWLLEWRFLLLNVLEATLSRLVGTPISPRRHS